MRVADQHNFLTVTIVGGIDFRFLHCCDRQDDLCALPGEGGRFQMDDGRITFICKVHKKLPLDSRVVQRANLGEFIGRIGIGQTQLLLDQFDGLLG